MVAAAAAARPGHRRAAPGRATSGRRPLRERQPSLALGDSYTLPSVDLLNPPPPPANVALDKAALERNARLLESVLDDFSVKGEIVEVRPGPVVTMYELEPASGIKASRVIQLADDIARNMSALSARVATIPGRAVIGIELPNAKREMVILSELIASPAFEDQVASLPIILGKNIAGDPVVADLAPMPHLLVAGTTGSGKSVGLNCMILSLLYRLTPEQCKMILIDPKMLELSVYDDIPHLLAPVVTEPAKAIRALKWTVEQMEERYRMMASVGVRQLSSFNAKVREAQDEGPAARPPRPDRLRPRDRPAALRDGGARLRGAAADRGRRRRARRSDDDRRQGGRVPDPAARAEGARGRHPPDHGDPAPVGRRHHRRDQGEPADPDLLLGHLEDRFAHHPRRAGRRAAARQGRHALHARRQADRPRPRPVRLRRGGARGRRSSGARQGQPDYVQAVTEEPEDGGYMFEGQPIGEDDAETQLFRKAVQVVAESQKASTSYLQRQLRVGYNNAARLIERMEKEGVVSAPDHVGRREVLVDPEGRPLV